VFALTALLLHGELAAARPSPAHLTEYYLWLALGGALGGAFNALVAPVVFKSIAEYESVAIVACFLRPSRSFARNPITTRFATAALALLPALILGVVVGKHLSGGQIAGVSAQWIASIAAAVIALSLNLNTPRFGVSLAAIALLGLRNEARNSDVLFADRSFFGAYRVERWSRTNTLMHGTTIHGAQYFDPARRLEPLTYYHRAGPAGDVFTALNDRLAGTAIASVGLGAGSLLCYAQPGERWSVFEIDPLVERIARDTNYFTFVRDCAAHPRIVLGDARLTLAREPSATYQLLILDAFSSDAIPLHLMTREAFASYKRVLTPDGALLVHISNRHLDLQPVIATAAADAGLVAYIDEHDVDESREDAELDYSSDWVVLARKVEDLGSLAMNPNWQRMTADPHRRPWTDDYSNILGVIKW
jgi:SAM-dependent methyltransferase